jgi:hypothetical protein
VTTPELTAYPDGDQPDSGLRAWCAWCHRWHHHGPGYGHRVAHCHNQASPYRDGGYILTKPKAKP